MSRERSAARCSPSGARSGRSAARASWCAPTTLRENRALRRTCYADLDRDARQFTTALNQHLHTLRERTVDARQELWDPLRVMREAMRADLGVG
ncbi:hypothetical protein [Streptomyces sp. NPDC005533]|uniref:hypothetical protein n=1 Tax=Streptomyces sp. NPDC005533 TaxID=3364723 RepID=UPI0036B48D2F